MFAEIKNKVIHFYDSGQTDKPVLIFLHAFPLNHKMWLKQTRFFRDNYRVIAPDFYGFGVSSRNNYIYTIDFFADEVFELMEFLKLEKANFVGLSMGGYVLFRLFEKYPEKIKSIILASTRSEADSNTGKVLRSKTIENILTNELNSFAEDFVNNLFTNNANESDVNEIIEMIKSADNFSVAAALVALSARVDSNQMLAKINIPTCVICGSNDNLTPISCSENLHKNIKNSTLNIINGASHLCNIEQSEEFNNIVSDFLKNNAD